MRRFLSLPCLLAVMWTTSLAAAAGPGAPQPGRTERKVTPPAKTEPKRETVAASQPAPSKPAPSQPAESKPKTTASKAPPKKPFIAQSEPRRETPASSAPKPAEPKPAASAPPPVASAPSRREIPRSTVSTEPVEIRRVLRESGQWLGAVQAQQADLSARLQQDRRGLQRIESDPAFAALPSQRNRQEAAMPAATALSAHAQRDWTRQLSARGSRPAPMQVEQLMRQGETIAFRTSTSTTDTQGLVAKIRRTPGVAAGGHLGADAMAGDLVTAHLRTVPGPLGNSAVRQPYAVQRADSIRARQQAGKADLDAQFAAVRRDWLVSAARAEELHRSYLQLRTALVAPDPP
jgi:hypothetical protein